jgi:hypothetical protein
MALDNHAAISVNVGWLHCKARGVLMHRMAPTCYSAPWHPALGMLHRRMPAARAAPQQRKVTLFGQHIA